MRRRESLSERDGESQDRPVCDREAGGGGEAGVPPPPSCERLQAVCASTSGWAGRAERTDVRLVRGKAKRRTAGGRTPRLPLHWPLQDLSVFV